jgi:hypothetical protein
MARSVWIRAYAKWSFDFEFIFNRPTKDQSIYSSGPIWDGRCHVPIMSREPGYLLLSMHCEPPDYSAVPPILWTEIFQDVHFSFCG